MIKTLKILPTKIQQNQAFVKSFLRFFKVIDIQYIVICNLTI